jgi:hypothetical protein
MSARATRPARDALRRALGVLAGVATLAAPAGATESFAFQSQAIDGVIARLQIRPSRHSPTGAAEFDHRIIVLLTDRASDRPVADATVAVDVAKAGRTGRRWPLASGTFEGRPAYLGDVLMAGRGTTYRVLVQFRRPGDAETLEAEFRYAHH